MFVTFEVPLGSQSLRPGHSFSRPPPPIPRALSLTSFRSFSPNSPPHPPPLPPSTWFLTLSHPILPFLPPNDNGIRILRPQSASPPSCSSPPPPPPTLALSHSFSPEILSHPPPPPPPHLPSKIYSKSQFLTPVSPSPSPPHPSVSFPPPPPLQLSH